ncbi:MAG: hypothetical protein ACE5I3_03340, partial [Phycisphaerae bacterium]
MTKKNRIAGGAIALAMAVGTASAQVETQWNFDGDLSAAFGNAVLDYYTEATQSKVTFGDAAALAALTPDGGNPNVIALDYFATSDEAFVCQHDAPPNGGGIYVNEYTLIWDIYIPQSSFDNYGWLSFYNTNCCNGNDGDHFVRFSDGKFGVGALGYAGQINPDTWHRCAITFEVHGGGVRHRRYIDGVLVAQRSTDLDGRFSLYSADDPSYPWFHLMADNNGDMAPCVIASVYFSDRVWTAAEIAALGCVSAGGATTAG